MPGQILVEGHGDILAAENLIQRVWRAGGHPGSWTSARRWKGLGQANGAVVAAERFRRQPDVEALLMLRDADGAEDCPRTLAPDIAARLRRLNLPFPCAVVLLHPEFEVLFLPCVEQMAGQELGEHHERHAGLRAGTRWDGATWEARRGIKEWLTAHWAPGRTYRPTIDQLPMTRLVDLDRLGASGVPSFGSLLRAVEALAVNWGTAGFVYPPAV